MKTGYFSTRQMVYGRPGADAQNLERGEIFQLAHTPNDPALINGGYIIDIAASHMEIEKHACTRCNKEFADSSYKFGHDSGDNPCGKAARGEPADIDALAKEATLVGSMPGEKTD